MVIVENRQGMAENVSPKRVQKIQRASKPSKRRDSMLDKTYVDPSYQPKVLLSGDGGPEPSVEATTEILNDLEAKSQNICRVLVLYTGGTIGMKNVDGVYVPVCNYMVSQLRRLPMCHDVEYADKYFSEEDEFQPCVMPETKDGKRVIYTVCEYEPLLDSSNITITDYARLATDIKKNYDYYEGFVILHGTDTMAYTASALSFMLENLGKPVVITGSQIPIFETRSDGRDNFLGALIMAGSFCIPEVTLYFHNKLIRGNRATKIDSAALDAFNSPNLRPLAELNIDIHVEWQAVFGPNTMAKMDICTNMCPNVGILRLFPSITNATVRAFMQPPMQGVIIQTYGAGNGPDARKDLLQVFKEASDRGIIVINISQCPRGYVTASYATGKALLDVGIIPGSDMTVEAALTKLAYVLGKEEWSLDKQRKMMGTNLRGEMKVVYEEEDQNLATFPLVERLKEVMRLSSTEEVNLLRDTLMPTLVCSAAKEGSIEALEDLKDAGAVFASHDFDGRSPLHVVASEGHSHLLRYLLENGATVHGKDRYGHTPLIDAIKFDNHDIIKMLVQTGACLNLPQYKVGIELCLCAAHGDLQRLQSWHYADADLNQGDYDNRTALHVAVCHGHIDIVRYLVEHGADINHEDNFNRTPMDEAEKSENEEILELLLNYKHTGAISNGIEI